MERRTKIMEKGESSLKDAICKNHLINTKDCCSFVFSKDSCKVVNVVRPVI